MRKLASMILTFTVAAASFAAVPVYAADFTDMPTDHWAYESVMKLTADGTINGYSDGSFAPSGVVTRAEFVKMLGKSAVRFESDFPDVPTSHWCYDYIMYSGLDGDALGNFNPDDAILRSDCANLLYKRYANGADEKAPYSISSQGTDSAATAWVYNMGLMIGDDMLDLRLGDTLTRAEAAVLIVRAQELDTSVKRSFIDNFSDDVYKAVYEGSNLFDTAYVSDENISNGEVASAALRFQFRKRTIPLGNYYYEEKFDGDYAAEWNIMCTNALDEKAYTSSEEESKADATVANALAMISYCAEKDRYVGVDVKSTGKSYSELNFKDANSAYADSLGFAYDYGISLYAGGKINAAEKITKKELACILMQYDLCLGLNIGYRCGLNSTYVPMPIRSDVANYPANASEYTAVLTGIPNAVYEAEFKDGKDGAVTETCAQTTSFAGTVSALLTVPLNEACQAAYANGIEVYITFLPTMVAETENSYVYRLMLEFENAPEGALLSDVFALGSGIEDVPVSSGSVIWLDLSANAKITGLYMDFKKMTVEQIHTVHM